MKMKITNYSLLIITLLLCGLKLFNIISWSWIWCLSLIWIPLALILVLSLIAMITFGIILLIAFIEEIR
jgi:hypothetical protein